VYRKRTAENVFALVALQWVTRGLSVVTKVVLARFLLPDDFGTFALAVGLIGFMATFGNFGLDYAVVQKGPKAGPADYDVAMSLRLAISAVLFGVTFVIAFPWASIFQNPGVTVTTQVLAFIYLATPWSFVPSTRLTAELRYRALAIPNLLGQVVSFCLSIALALMGLGIWALVIPLVLSQIAVSIAFGFIHPWKFRISFRWATARPLLSFARHLVAVSVLGFLITNIDNFTIGYLMGSAALGFYAVAYGFGFLPVSLFSSPASSALFPTLVKIQGDQDRLRKGYLESFGYLAALAIPAGVGLAVVAPEAVHVFLGSLWQPVALPLVVLSFYGLARAIEEFSSSLFSAVGTPKKIAQLNFLILLGSIPLLYPLTVWYGILGTAVAMTVPMIVGLAWSIVLVSRVLDTPTASVFSRMKCPLIAAGAMGVAVILLKFILYSFLPDRLSIPWLPVSVSQLTIGLALSIPCGILLYVATLRVLDESAFVGMRQLMFGIADRRPT